MSNKVDFILPDLGEGVHEAEIIAWKVKEGDVVEEMQVLAEMETDKALVEVPSPFAGKVVALHGSEGDIAHVGNPIVTFKDASQSGKPVNGGPSAAASSSSTNGKSAEAATPPSASAEEREDAGTVVGTVDSSLTLGRSGAKVMATPAVRRLAKELGVDINTVAGSGRGGRVTASDVQASASGGGATAAPAAPATAPSAPAFVAPPPPISVDATGTSRRVAFRGVRRKIAEALDRSVKTAVHFTVMDEAEVTALDRVRRQTAHTSGEKVSFLPFLIQAVSRCLREYPDLNANVDDANSEILIKGVHNIGIAVDTDHGLMVPVIDNADQIPVLPLGRTITDLATKCRNRTVPVENLRGGTFTISNVGSYGGAYATPIINYPEVGILAAGRARESVVARNGGMFIGKVMPLSLSCDHRVVDGAYGARFLNAVVQMLENPEMLLDSPRG